MIYKFRAWDDKNKKFAFTGFFMLGETVLFDMLTQYSVQEVVQLKIDIFAQCKDADNLDIYVNDIVKIGSLEYVVGWNEGAFRLMNPMGTYHLMNIHRVAGKVKIVGNNYLVS